MRLALAITSLVVIVISICFAGMVAAQQQPAPSQQTDQPTFRTGANYVRVDMYPTRNGQPVEDLRQDEIELLASVGGPPWTPARSPNATRIAIRPSFWAPSMMR